MRYIQICYIAPDCETRLMHFEMSAFKAYVTREISPEESLKALVSNAKTKALFHCLKSLRGI